jgi:hypothetical protein
MNKALKIARQRSGLARYERTTTEKKYFGKRLMRAWRVPGTQEHAKHSELQAVCEQEFCNLLRGKK